MFTVYIKEIQYFRFVTNTFCVSRKLTVFLLFENKPEKKFEWTKILPTMRKKKVIWNQNQQNQREKVQKVAHNTKSSID